MRLQPCVCIAMGTRQDLDMHNRHAMLLRYTPLCGFESHGHHCVLHSKHDGDTKTYLVYAICCNAEHYSPWQSIRACWFGLFATVEAGFMAMKKSAAVRTTL